jgi:ribosome biogenesis GTPase / thiamine phosphate phosphatase
MEKNMKGRVLKSTGSWYEVTHENERYQCRLRGKFKIKGLKVTNPIAVGDFVEFELESEGTGVITDICPRQNYIIRKSTHNTRMAHILAANLDQALLIVTMVFPRTSLGFIDRFLVSAEAYGIPAALVFNKTDLLDGDLLQYQNDLAALYESLGYSCLFTSAIQDEGIDQLKALMKGKVSLLSGHSGVGKSTIVNKIAPFITQKTSEVSTFANKGVHTTTFAEMFEIAPQTYLIDTPGIKELGLIDIEESELNHFFPEMREKIGHCRFHNCTHLHEPGCAILEAVQNGEIAISRYENYLGMLSGEDNRR